MPKLEVQELKKDFKMMPAGTHMARVIRVIDLGIQTTPFKDKQGNNKKHQIVIYFEVPSQKMDDGRPMIIRTQPLTYSLGYPEFKTKLREYAEEILGRQIETLDLAELLGKPAMLKIAHIPGKEPGKKYAAITGVMQIPEGANVPEPFNPLINFSTVDFKKDVFDQLDEYTRKKINLPEGINFNAASNEELGAEELLA